jgi:hypothetical protein
MTKRHWLLLCLGITLLCCAAIYAQQGKQLTTTPSTAGRYQLFQGEYQFINYKGQEYWLKALFRIDTETGAVWIGNQVQTTDNQDKVTQTRYWEAFELTMQVPIRQ